MPWTLDTPTTATVPGPTMEKQVTELRLGYELEVWPGAVPEITVHVREGYTEGGVFAQVGSIQNSPFEVPSEDAEGLAETVVGGPLRDEFESLLWTWLAENGKIPAGGEA